MIAWHVSTTNGAIPRAPSGWHWTLLRDALMGTGMVGVGDVFCEYASEMPLVKDQELVQAFLADGPNPSLGERIDYPDRLLVASGSLVAIAGS